MYVYISQFFGNVFGGAKCRWIDLFTSDRTCDW